MWRYYHFTHVWFLRYGAQKSDFFFDMYHKWKSYDVWFLRCGAWQSEFFVILGHFWPFTPLTTKKIKIKKKQKNARRYCHFTYVYHKWRSYDVWFLRYGAQQADFFVILDHFLPFYSPNNLGNHEIWSTIKFLSF